MPSHATYLVTHDGVEYVVGKVNSARWCYDILWFGGLWNCCTKSGTFQYYQEEVAHVELEPTD